VAAELWSLVLMPFPTALSALYFWGLWREARPSVLALLLALLSTVALICGTWLGAASFSTRVLNRPFPPEVLPITLAAIQGTLYMVCISAFVLWRSRANGGVREARERTQDATDEARENKRDAADAAREETRDQSDEVREEQHANRLSGDREEGQA
jgi:predicted Rdx family selenoprotein